MLDLTRLWPMRGGDSDVAMVTEQLGAHLFAHLQAIEVTRHNMCRIFAAITNTDHQTVVTDKAC